MNTIPKIVYSTTLTSVRETEKWKNVRLAGRFDPEEVRRMKAEDGKDIGVGGSNLALSFIKHGLIDEFRFMVVPCVIGRGTPIFAGLEERLNLDLISTRRFGNGNVLLTYRPHSLT